MDTLSFTTIMSLFGAHDRLEQRFSAELGAVHGLSLKEALLLLHLDHSTAGKLSRVDLAQRLSSSASTVTRLAQPLEKLHLVGRETDARDARLAYVVLTEAGRAAAADLRATLRRQAEEAFLRAWSSDEIANLSEGLSRLAAGRNSELR